jgi:hypothetical protein
MILQDITIYSNKKEHHDLLGQVCSSFYFCLSEVRINRLGRVSITFHERKKERTISWLQGVCSIEEPFDYSAFEAMGLDKQRKYVLDHVLSGLEAAILKYGWKELDVQAAYRKVLNSDFRCSVVLEPVTYSRNRHLKAGMEISQSEGGAMIAVVFFDKDNILIKRVPVQRTNHNGYRSFLGKRGWIDNQRYAITTHYSARYIVSIDSEEVAKEQSRLDFDQVMRHSYSLKGFKRWDPRK